MKLPRLRRPAQPPEPMADQIIGTANDMTHLDRELGAEISSVIGQAKHAEVGDAVYGVFEDLIESCQQYAEDGCESATADEFARDSADGIRALIALIEKAA
ncbi:hypothetical protein [Saccharopolyspora sp. 6V]|uniref:hypothetical protein n=1 Tax=Saccharopolyspora sp. 6V TaxID=2877239 RepID=UPI001CD45AE9|nr:hypothetical protein [Saccharopolyspora sp. 6V]MCA1191654.1 hypothetical protein [Saccharopolyspora sp. 6V]